MAGTFYGVGVGPGDPELITLKAARLIKAADVVAFHSGVGKQSNARRIAADLIPPNILEEELRYPVTTGTTTHPGGYRGALEDFYQEAAERLAAHLAAGCDVVLLAEGDPMFYGSFMYMHDRLSPRFKTLIVPGVPAFAAATAAAAVPLVRQTDVLTILPGTLPAPELARRLSDTDAAVIMKLGRTFPTVVKALAEAGRDHQAIYVEQASTPQERSLPLADVDPKSVPYFSLILVPGDSRHGSGSRDRNLTTSSQPKSTTPELVVVGLGPGPGHWITPEVSAALENVEHVVGYAPYVNRIPQRPGLQRHASGNTVELDRARLALDLTLNGERVAVVSGGDAGVFGMAAAVFEAAEDPTYEAITIRVLPGLSAIQAVAARAGAPIGGDFAVISLSDRLKPWSVIEQRLHAIAQADLVLAIYNPASRTRREQIAQAQEALLKLLPADRVVVVGRSIGRPDEELEVTTLGALDTGSIDMSCLVIIGASGTRVSPRGSVWTSRGTTQVR